MNTSTRLGQRRGVLRDDLHQEYLSCIRDNGMHFQQLMGERAIVHLLRMV